MNNPGPSRFLLKHEILGRRRGTRKFMRFGHIEKLALADLAAEPVTNRLVE
jgi:hypothetical protein